MHALEIIRRKRDGHALERAEIEAFVQGATHHTWPDYQLAALLMAIVLRGMTSQETAWLTAAMVQSGVRLDLSDLPGPKVDKHSTGGVGDKTSLVLAPLAAACGVIVPMMSGRGLGHTGGTLDKLESIPGFRVGLSLEEFRTALRQVGCALIGQTAEIAPADKVLYALRDVTSTVESIPLISASIMSKKIAEGIGALVLDVKYGRGAFMKNVQDAHRLAESLVAIGKSNGVRTQALLTGMDVPLGRAVGNSLEVIECLEILKGRGPTLLTDLSVTLAAHMLHLGGIAANLEGAQRKVREALGSGRGLEKFREIIAHQGGDPRIVDDYSFLPTAPHKHRLVAERDGYVTHVNAELLGRATMLLGAGRTRVEDTIDHAVGALVRAHQGHRVKAGEALVEIHYRDETKLDMALPLFEHAWHLDESPVTQTPLILDTIG